MFDCTSPAAPRFEPDGPLSAVRRFDLLRRRWIATRASGGREPLVHIIEPTYEWVPVELIKRLAPGVVGLIWLCNRLIKRSQDDRSHRGENESGKGWPAV